MILYVALAALAVFRVSHMLAYEDGPFAAFLRFREMLRMKAMTERVPEWVADGVSCAMCISFYLGFVAALPVALVYDGGLLVYVVASLAMSGVTVFLVSIAEPPE